MNLVASSLPETVLLEYISEQLLNYCLPGRNLMLGVA